MNITLSIDEDVVKEVRKIAIERDTTLTALVRSYLQELAAEHARSGRKRRELEALEESFRTLQFNMGEKTWKREDLYERGSHNRPKAPE
jgi:predicted RNase H-like nuclease (RuvC/YqgF family)